MVATMPGKVNVCESVFGVRFAEFIQMFIGDLVHLQLEVLPEGRVLCNRDIFYDRI